MNDEFVLWVVCPSGVDIANITAKGGLRMRDTDQVVTVPLATRVSIPFSVCTLLAQSCCCIHKTSFFPFSGKDEIKLQL